MSKKTADPKLPRAPFPGAFAKTNGMTENEIAEEIAFAGACHGLWPDYVGKAGAEVRVSGSVVRVDHVPNARTGLGRITARHGADRARLELGAMLAGQAWIMQQGYLLEFFRRHSNAIKRLLRPIAESNEAAQLATRYSLSAVSEGHAYTAFLNEMAGKILNREKKGNDQVTRTKLAATVSDHGQKLFEYLKVPASANPEQGKPEIENGILAIDERYAAYMDDIGDIGKKTAAVVRRQAAKRMLKYTDGQTEPGDLWALWVDFTGRPIIPAYLKLLGIVVLYDIVCPPSVGLFSIKDYSKMPKATAGISWAFGGAAVEVDGEQYAQTPTVSERMLLPRAWPLLPAGQQIKPHQTVLALATEDTKGEVLAIAVTDATKYGAITTAGSKIALCTLASEGARYGKVVKATAEEFARYINPKAKRIQRRELEGTAVGFTELDALFVFLSDWTKVRFFDARIPVTVAKVTREMELAVGLNTVFRDLVKTLFKGKGNPYSGYFLLNLSGTMRLPNSRPSLMRHYVRAAAGWNAAFKGAGGAFDKAHLKHLSTDEWAAITNTYQLGVVEYLTATGQDKKKLRGRRHKLSTERKRLLSDFEYLEADGLVVIEKVGKRYGLLPPETYHEAKADVGKQEPQKGKPKRKPKPK